MCTRCPIMNRPSVKSNTGFDRHKGMIEWCREQITSRDPRFQFKYFELKSVYSVLDNGKEPLT